MIFFFKIVNICILCHVTFQIYAASELNDVEVILRPGGECKSMKIVDLNE